MTANWKIKVLICGDRGVGKTSFLHDNDGFSEGRYSSANTMGITIKTSQVTLGKNGDGESCMVSLWDQKSRRRFVFMYPAFYRGAAGAILCFDVSNRQSFIDLPLWLDLIRKINNNIPIVLVGTK